MPAAPNLQSPDPSLSTMIMESSANAALGVLGLWMWLMLVGSLALLLGGMYALYCLGRAAAGLDRLASAVEELANRQPGDTITPQGNVPSGPGPGSTVPAYAATPPQGVPAPVPSATPASYPAAAGPYPSSVASSTRSSELPPPDSSLSSPPSNPPVGMSSPPATGSGQDLASGSSSEDNSTYGRSHDRPL